MADLYDLGINDLTENLRETLAASTADSLARGGQHVRDIAAYFQEEAGNKAHIATVHQSIANYMQEAVVEGYQQNVIDVRAAPSYRSDDPYRDAGGKLGRALNRKSMVIGDSEGISFINTTILDSTARQWARLNFGAGPNIGNTVGAKNPRTGRIRFGSGVGISIRFAEGPGDNFGVPNAPAKKGFFNSRGQLFLNKEFPKGINNTDSVDIAVKGKPSKVGIGARRFLDQGLVALGANYGPAFREHFQDAKNEAISRARQEKIDAGGRDHQAIYARRKARGYTRWERA